jgi:hypothetical protein
LLLLVPQGQFLLEATPILLKTHSAHLKVAIIAESIVSDPTVQVSDYSLAIAGCVKRLIDGCFQSWFFMMCVVIFQCRDALRW